MKINLKQINQSLKHTVAKSKIEKLFTEQRRQVEVCPFTITLGYINATESGYSTP